MLSKPKFLNDVATPYFVAQTLSYASTSIPHAILTPLLLSKGLSLSQILLVQAAFSMATFAFEVPSGALADLFSRKFVYLLSKLSLLGYFLLVIYGESFGLLLVAWIMYGIAGALGSGTIDAALVNDAKTRISKGKVLETRLSWLARRESSSNLIGMLIGSTLGAFLYAAIGVNIYFISVVGVVFAILVVWVFFQIPPKAQDSHRRQTRFSEEIRSHFQETLVEMRESAVLRQVLVLAILVQAFMQLHFQLWQALALEKGLPEAVFIGIYLTSISISLVASFVQVERIARRIDLIGTALVLFACSSVLVFYLPSWWYLPFYGLLILLLACISNFVVFQVRKSSSVERIGAISSLVSVASRVGAIFTLLVTSLLIRTFSAASILSVGYLALVVISVSTFIIFKPSKVVPSSNP